MGKKGSVLSSVTELFNGGGKVGGMVLIRGGGGGGGGGGWGGGGGGRGVGVGGEGGGGGWVGGGGGVFIPGDLSSLPVWKSVSLAGEQDGP